jgi:hypothetical protein
VADVFVSYKREDRERVSVIADLLSDLGLSVWFDASLAAGERWRAEITEEVEAASAMLVCWTPAATKSVQVMIEVKQGLERGILAPVYLEKTVLPAGLGAIHTSDLSKWDYALDAADWLALLAALERLVDRDDLQTASRQRAAGKAAASMMRSILIEAAKAGRLLSYAQGVATLQAALRAAYREHAPKVNNHFLYGALDATAAENRARREPPLCISVVNKTGMPGKGYFQKHAFLSGNDDPLAESLFERHLERVRTWAWDKDAA